MSSVLHVSSGSIAPSVVAASSRFYSAASSRSAPAPFPRLAGFRKPKSSLSSSSSCSSSSYYCSVIRLSNVWNVSKKSSSSTTASDNVFKPPSSAAKSFATPGPSPTPFSRPPGAPRGGFSMPRGWLSKLGLGGGANQRAAQTDAYNSAAQGTDDDKPAAGQQFATFGAGCFWGVELAFQRVPGVTKTEVGYSQGLVHEPTYGDVCDGDTMHSEVVRVEFDPAQCQYEKLLEVFWGQHDPTTLNRQGGDRGTQYRSGIYFHSPEQEKAAKESAEKEQKKLNNKIVTEILAAKKFYRAEEYHQQYLAKGGRFGYRQSASKGCNDPIRCYG